MENVKKKMPLLVVIAIATYLVLGGLLSVVSNVYDVIKYMAYSQFIGDLFGDFMNSIWVMLLAVFVMFVYRKNDKSILLPMALIVGTVTSFIAACTLGWDFVEYVIHIPEYGIEINFFEVVDILTWIVAVVAEFFVPLALLAVAVGAFSRKLLLLSKIGSIAYLLVCVVNLVSNAIYSLTFVVSQDYMSIIERISNRVIYFSVYIVEFLPAIALALLFFKYIKKPREEVEAAPVEITEEI